MYAKKEISRLQLKLIIWPKMAVIISGLTTSNEGDGYGLLFTASPLGLNSKRI